MYRFFCRVWCQDEGQDIAEYALMMAIILGLVIGTLHMIGAHADTTFSGVGSAISGNNPGN